MSSARASLPGVLAEIATAAGEDAARAIVRKHGGTQIYIPPSPGPDHWLSQLVGPAKARAIAEHLTCGVGPLRLEVPLAGTGSIDLIRERCDAMLRAGRSERDIARACGYTIRGVRKRRAKLRDERQLNLFQH